MTPEQFYYWLQGYAEGMSTDYPGLSNDQWNTIKEHLKEVSDRQIALAHPIPSLFNIDKIDTSKTTC